MAKMELKELRKKVKPLGYKVKTESLSWGRHITYVHAESGTELTQNVFTSEQLEMWQPLFDSLKELEGSVIVDNYGDEVRGSKIEG